jgi:hypothetical protein
MTFAYKVDTNILVCIVRKIWPMEIQGVLNVCVVIWATKEKHQILGVVVTKKLLDAMALVQLHTMEYSTS